MPVDPCYCKVLFVIMEDSSYLGWFLTKPQRASETSLRQWAPPCQRSSPCGLLTPVGSSRSLLGLWPVEQARRSASSCSPSRACSTLSPRRRSRSPASPVAGGLSWLLRQLLLSSTKDVTSFSCLALGRAQDWLSDMMCGRSQSLIFPRYWVIKSVDLAGTQSREGRRLKKRCLTGYTMTTLILAFRWSMAAGWEMGKGRVWISKKGCHGRFRELHPIFQTVRASYSDWFIPVFLNDFFLCGTFVGFAHLQMCLAVNLQIRRPRQWHQIPPPPRQRNQKNENNQQRWQQAREEFWDKGRRGGGAGGWQLWQAEKWSTGLAFIWAALGLARMNDDNHYFTTIVFYLLVDWVRDAGAASFDFFIWLLASFAKD